MIIPNGTIQVKQKTAGGIDPETGYPVKSGKASWGDPIPCQYIANKYDHLGRVNGQAFTTAQYHILIEEQPFTAEQLRLKDSGGKSLGDFSVITTEYLQAVSEVSIMV